MTNAANSIQRDVEPGCKTGLYYITIANLPFGTSWHLLKDWLRHTCDVEHVEIFNSSTSGWIRVRGEDNFRRALGRLNQCDFGGRCIIADGRNATERIKIKELIGDSSPLSVSSASPRISRMSSVARSSYGEEVNSIASPMMSSYRGQWSSRAPSVAAPYSPYSSIASPAPYHAEATKDIYYSSSNSTTGYTDSGGGYPYEIDPVVGVHVPQPPYDDSCYGEDAATLISEPYSSSSSSGGAYLTEQRKIIVRHLGHNASEDQLRKLIKASLKTVTTDKHQLQHIEFPCESDGRLRGYIFATFKTPEVALGVMEDLQGRPFQRRYLDVQLTTEGIPHRAGDHREHGDHEHDHDHDYDHGWDDASSYRDKPKKDKKDGDKSKSKTSKGRGHSDRTRIPPIIANGTSQASTSPERTTRRRAM